MFTQPRDRVLSTMIDKDGIVEFDDLAVPLGEDGCDLCMLRIESDDQSA